MIKKISFTIIVFLLFTSKTIADWYNRPLVSQSAGNEMRYIVVGRGRDTTTNFVYSASYDKYIYEYQYSGTSWSVKQLPIGDDKMTGVAVAKCHSNDSIFRVYGSNFGTIRGGGWRDGNILEFSYNSPSWEIDDIGGNIQYIGYDGYEMNFITAGIGRDTGKNYLYIANNAGYVYEYGHNGSWSRTETIYRPTLTADGAYYSALCVLVSSSVRSGGYRVYSGYREKGSGRPTHNSVWEHSYNEGNDVNGDGWGESRIAYASSGFTELCVGNGRNDSTVRLYASNENGSISEFTYSGSSWSSYTLDVSTSHFHDVVVAKGRYDSINHIYTTCANGKIYEFTWNGSNAYTLTNTIPIGTGAELRGLTFADGRNDNIPRFYCGADNGLTYELMFDSSPPNSKIKIPVNNSSHNTSITTISGSAQDNLGVRRVYLNISCINESTTFYWDARNNNWTTTSVSTYIVPAANLANINWSYNSSKVAWQPGRVHYIRSTATDLGLNQESQPYTISLLFDNVAPAKITDFSGKSGNNDGDIILSWTSPGNDGTYTSREITNGKYVIKYSSSSSSVLDKSIEISTSVSKGTPSSYTLTGLNKGTSYYLTITTFDEIKNQSLPSETIVAKARDLPPSRPNGFSITNPQNGQTLKLNWIPNQESDISGYKLYRSTFSCLLIQKELLNITLDKNTTFYFDNGLTTNVSYYYQLLVYDNNSNDGLPTDEISDAPIDNQPPVSPVNVRLIPGDTFIKISWSTVSEPDIVAYLIQKSSQNNFEGFNNLTTILSPGTTHQDNGLTNHTTYWYRMQALDYYNNYSTYSVVVGTYPFVGGDVTPPGKITDLTAFTGSIEGSIKLQWTGPGDNDFSGNLNGKYTIYRTTSATKNYNYSEYYTEITTDVPVNTVQNYDIKGLKGGVTYYFWINSEDDIGNLSEISNKTTAYAQVDNIPPAQVTDLAALPGNLENEIVLTWTYTGDNGFNNNLTNNNG